MSDLITACRQIVDEHQYQVVDGHVLDATTANVILRVHDALSEPNRAKLLDRSTPEVAHIAWTVLERAREAE